MSINAIRVAFETQLATILPAIDTVPFGTEYDPIEGRPYQEWHLLLADPDDSEQGGTPVERGIFQITLKFPSNEGSGDINTRLDLIRTAFKKKTPLVSGGVTVTIQKTPSVAAAQPDGDRISVPISIRFTAPIT